MQQNYTLRALLFVRMIHFTNSLLYNYPQSQLTTSFIKEIKKGMNKFILLALVWGSMIGSLAAQNWKITTVDQLPVLGIKDFEVEDSRLFQVDDEKMRLALWSAPSEAEYYENGASGELISFPLADGTLDQFFVYRYEMMEPELAEKYPDIRTFVGNSREVKHRRIRIDYTVHGVRAVITDFSGQTYIDHYQRNDKANKIVYRRSAFKTDKSFSCEVEEIKNNKIEKGKGSLKQLLGDCELRTYRLAQTTTGEYSNFHGATSPADAADVLSAITTTINRVNQVYEQDLTVRFVLIANTDDLFYYDANTDPFDGNSASNMINANQTNTTTVIGAANYDIGHIFSTGGSGLAGLGVVCNNSSKARGVTGIANPVGDPFDIDYVSHEIGHQCGGNHTQNNSCNRSGTSVEVGSGFTIMGYAGICSPNVINNSIAMFNTANIIEMSTTLGGGSCHGTVNISNNAPVAGVIEDKVIPHSTPFVLDVQSTDADPGDILTYAWEQQDAEVASMPPQGTNTGGPTFRSYLPSASSERYYPLLDVLINGASDTWEVLPTVGREMNFIYTVRDHGFLPGCIDTANVKLTVNGSSGPFNVTSQASAQSFLEYSNVTVTWDVGNTSSAPINTKLVDILYSRDGGFTYLDTLVYDTRNDGTKVVVIPPGVETDGRFMVKAKDNYFFDVNETNFEVTNAGASYQLTLDDYYSQLCTTGDPIDVEISAEAFEGFSSVVNLSLSSVPTGLNASLQQNVISQGTSTLMTLSDFSGLNGEYVIEINGESNGINRTVEFYIDVLSGGLTTTLTEPADQALNVVNNPLLKWTSVAGAVQYEYEILNQGGSIIQTGLVNTTSFIPLDLPIDGTFTWRVRPIFACGSGTYSSSFDFSTGLCYRNTSRIPLVIPTNVSTVSAIVDVPFSGVISDVNILDLDITHSWIADLDVELQNPSNLAVTLYDNTCGQDDDILLSYDTESSTDFSCAIRTSGSTVKPVDALTLYNGEELNGEWELIINDVENGDGGAVNEWTLEVCFESSCDLTVDKTTFDDGAGSLKEAISCAVDGDVITFSNTLMNSTINLGNESIVLDKNLTLNADFADQIKLVSTSTNPLLTVNASKSVTVNGLYLENLTTSSGVVKNDGNLTIENVEVTSGTGKTGVQSDNGNILFIGVNNKLSGN